MSKWIDSLEPVVYSNDAIDRDLSRICNCVAKYDQLFYPFFEVMYDLGVRAVESFELERWRVDPSGVIILQPQKGNDIRVFDPTLLSATYLAYITGEIKVPSYINYDRMNSVFKRYTMYHGIFVGDKKSSLHLFRHNFVKQQMLLDYTPEEIQQMLGERNLKSVMSYIDSVFTNKPLKCF